MDCSEDDEGEEELWWVMLWEESKAIDGISSSQWKKQESGQKYETSIAEQNATMDGLLFITCKFTSILTYLFSAEWILNLEREKFYSRYYT